MLSPLQSARNLQNDSLQIPPHLEGVTTLLCEILVFKIAPTESTASLQRQTRSSHMEENMTAIDELVLVQEHQPQIHHRTRQIAQSDAVYVLHTDHFSHRDLSLKCSNT